jgi:hypothetical protein
MGFLFVIVFLSAAEIISGKILKRSRKIFLKNQQNCLKKFQPYMSGFAVGIKKNPGL